MDKPVIYTVQPGSYVTVCDPNDIDRTIAVKVPITLVTKKDYDVLRDLAKRVALRAGFTAEALHDLLDLLTE